MTAKSAAGHLTKLPHAEQWADRICAQLGKSVEAIIEVGRLLVKAKADLEHGEWLRMFESNFVPFGIRSAQMLMAIAEHSALTNTKHVSYLPPSWGSLYLLTKVEPKRLTAAFRDGTITCDMPRKAVAALLPPRKKSATRRRRLVVVAEGENFSPEIECFFEVEARINRTFFALDGDAQLDLLGRLQQLCTQLEQGRHKVSA